MNRREFTKGCGLLVASSWAGCKKDAPTEAPTEAPVRPPPPKPAAEKPITTVFKDDEARAIAAALDRILPAGVPEGTPGASEARVFEYLNTQLQTPHFKDLVELMRSGGRALNGGARKANKIRWFWELSPSDQDALLHQFQTGDIALGRFNTVRFFEVLRTFALEGFLGHSRHGGNRGHVVWHSIGFAEACH